MTDGLGVSLAAIQALKQQLDEKSARIDALERERAVAQQTSDAARAAMDARLAALEQAVSSGNAMVATRP